MEKCVGFDQNFFFLSTDRVTLVAEEHRERKVTRYCDMYSSSKVKQLFTTMHRSSFLFKLLLCEHLLGTSSQDVPYALHNGSCV